ncbi:MAG: hypothetical protein KJ060_12645 [Candidatus Hydrogenedentes bacterium]|nr:hypothetical protein [Candidatus Hydrogenedentota bacterium]
MGGSLAEAILKDVEKNVLSIEDAKKAIARVRIEAAREREEDNGVGTLPNIKDAPKRREKAARPKQ